MTKPLCRLRLPGPEVRHRQTSSGTARGSQFHGRDGGRLQLGEGIQIYLAPQQKAEVKNQVLLVAQRPAPVITGTSDGKSFLRLVCEPLPIVLALAGRDFTHWESAALSRYSIAAAAIATNLCANTRRG